MADCYKLLLVNQKKKKS